jgi:hypothetical protein
LHAALRDAQDLVWVDVGLHELGCGLGEGGGGVEDEFGAGGFAVDLGKPVGAVVEEGYRVVGISPVGVVLACEFGRCSVGEVFEVVALAAESPEDFAGRSVDVDYASGEAAGDEVVA